MASPGCLVCGAECGDLKRSVTLKLRRIAQQWTAAAEPEDALLQILSMDVNTVPQEELLCVVCWQLTGQLRLHERRARACRAELLRRHDDRQRRLQGTICLTDTDVAAFAATEKDTPAPQVTNTTGCGDSQPDDVAVGDSQPSSADKPRAAESRSGAAAAVEQRDGDSPEKKPRAAESGCGAAARAEEQDDDAPLTEWLRRRPRRDSSATGDAAPPAAGAGDPLLPLMVKLEPGLEVDPELDPAADAQLAGLDWPLLQSDDELKRERSDGEYSPGGADSDAGSEYSPSGAAARPPAQLPCSGCQLTFDNRRALSRHRASAHRPSAHRRPHQCSLCQKAFKHPGTLTTHVRAEHSGGLPCQRTDCQQTFTSHILYYKHLGEVHGEHKHVCEHCGAGFARRALYNRHISKEKRKQRRMQRKEELVHVTCSVCEYRPSGPGDSQRPAIRLWTERRVVLHVRDHEYTRHGLHRQPVTQPETELKHTLSCAGCELKFACRKALASHKVRKHKDESAPPRQKEYVMCELCGKNIDVKYLKVHQEATHHAGTDAEVMLTCEHCGKQFHKYHRRHFVTHMEKAHNALGVPELPCPEADCSRVFRHQRGLRRHVTRQHATPAALPCGTCELVFTTPWQRDKHAAQQHGQYDYVCDECGEKYFRASELEIHVRRVHTRQLRLQCSVCDHRSEEKRKLLNHENAVHGMHREPLPPTNPTGQLSYPCLEAGCPLFYGCGNAVKQHAWDAHQLKLNIYGRPMRPSAEQRRREERRLKSQQRWLAAGDDGSSEPAAAARQLQQQQQQQVAEPMFVETRPPGVGASMPIIVCAEPASGYTVSLDQLTAALQN